MSTSVRARRLSAWSLLAALVLLVALVASGCKSAQPTPVEPTAALATRTPRPTFTPMSSATPLPTETLAPTRTPQPPTATPEPTASPTPTVDPNLSPLTGLPVSDPALLQRRVLAARIGNDPTARPQDGLGLADIVYEEIMDGWTLTRFTALYLGTNVERIRPIRSARLSTLQIVPQYDAAAVHSGASDHIRWMISQAGFVDLDEYYHDEPYDVLAGQDWRSRMYTSVEAIHAYLTANNQERGKPEQGYTFDATAPAGQPARVLHIPYPQLCTVDWAYDNATGRYLRTMQGQPHVEGLTGIQIGAENVIVFYTEHKKTDIVEDSLGSTAIDIVMTGEGRAQVCRDGVVQEARWARMATNEPIQYYDAAGKLIPLKPGQTWIQLVPVDYAVEIK
ncbi:MAG: DUF3048 domain-containing protein [Chloroflexi bacterium]|nr:DUF3048 domain-containing protein [Chloroflexota bacterium]